MKGKKSEKNFLKGKSEKNLRRKSLFVLCANYLRIFMTSPKSNDLKVTMQDVRSVRKHVIEASDSAYVLYLQREESRQL